MPKAPEPSSTCQKTTKSLPRISPKSYCYNAVPNRFLAHFSTSRTNGPRSLSRAKVGTHSAFGEKSHTTAHTPKQGRFGWGRYHYPRCVPHVHEHPRAGYQNGKLCRFGILAGRCSRRTQKAFGTAMRLCASLSRGVAAPLGCVICLQLGDVAVFSLCAQYFLNVRGGGGISTLGAFHTFRKPCVARCQNGKLCRFWVLVGGALEECREPAEQRCAYARRCSAGVAAPLGCVIFFVSAEIGICTSGAHGFPRVRGTGGITTLGALCVLLKCRTAACQKGSFAVF